MKTIEHYEGPSSFAALTFSRINKRLTSISLSLSSSAAHLHTPTRPICCFSTAVMSVCVLDWGGGGGWEGYIFIVFHWAPYLLAYWHQNRSLKGRREKLEINYAQGFLAFGSVLYCGSSICQSTGLLRFDVFSCRNVHGLNVFLVMFIYSPFWLPLTLYPFFPGYINTHNDPLTFPCINPLVVVVHGWHLSLGGVLVVKMCNPAISASLSFLIVTMREKETSGCGPALIAASAVLIL